MKRIIQFIIFLLTFIQLAGQNQFIEIHGSVIDESTNKPIPRVYIELTLSDTIKFKVRSDTNGKYSFFVSRKALTESARLIVWYDIKEYQEVKNKDTSCRYVNNFYGYMLPNIPFSITAIQNNKIYQDIKLKRVIACYSFPTIYFAKNSMTPVTDFLEDSALREPKNGLHFMECILKNNPTMIIELTSHCSSDENDKNNLSESRGKYVQTYLIKTGINSDRIRIKVCEDKQPFFEKNQIKFAKTPEEKEAMAARNRRLTFKCLSYDFGQ